MSGRPWRRPRERAPPLTQAVPGPDLPKTGQIGAKLGGQEAESPQQRLHSNKFESLCCIDDTMCNQRQAKNYRGVSPGLAIAALFNSHLGHGIAGYASRDWPA